MPYDQHRYWHPTSYLRWSAEGRLQQKWAILKTEMKSFMGRSVPVEVWEYDWRDVPVVNDNPPPLFTNNPTVK